VDYASATSQLKCLVCGEPLPDEAVYCPKCGHLRTPLPLPNRSFRDRFLSVYRTYFSDPSKKILEFAISVLVVIYSAISILALATGKADFSWPIKISVAIIVVFVVFVAVDGLRLSIMSRRKMIIPSFIALLFLLVPLIAALNSLEGFFTETAIAPYKLDSTYSIPVSVLMLALAIYSIDRIHDSLVEAYPYVRIFAKPLLKSKKNGS